MKRLLTTLIAASVVSIAGCKSTGHIKPDATSKISVGMTKAEVIKAIGLPETVSADGQAEVLTYTVERPWWVLETTTSQDCSRQGGVVPGGGIIGPDLDDPPSW